MPSPLRPPHLAPSLLLALLVALPSAAEIVAVGEPFVLAPGSTEELHSAEVAWLPPGAEADRPEGFVVAWSGRRGLDETVYRAFVPADPELPEVPAMLVAGPGRLFEPHVAAGLDRRSAIVFASSRDEHPACFAGLLYDPDLAPEASLDPAEPGPCNLPFLDAALLTGGQLVVVYERQRSDSVIDLWGQLFGPDGQPLGAPFLVSEPGANNAERVRAVAPSGSGFLVLSVYQSQNRFDPLGPSTLWANRFGADGERLAPPIQLEEAPGLMFDVSLVPAGGGFVAVWNEGAIIGDPVVVSSTWFGRRLAATGVPAGPVQNLLADVDPPTPRSVHAARGPGSTVLLGWTVETGAGFEVQAQLFTADLAAAGEQVTLVTGAALVALAASPAGDALAVLAGEDGGLVAQRLLVEGECTPSETVLCLQGGRFEVSVEWADFQGNAGPGRRVPVASDDSGLFWFFDPANWEMLVKVLDGCPVNGHFWVFSAAATNVEYTLTVSDLVAHQTRVFRNDLGDTARALTVTNAFPTCGVGGGEGGGGG